MDADVLVVGAGPVGLLLAGELRLGGAAVTVLERRAAPDPASRASTLHARTMELLDQRGLLAGLPDPPRDARGHFGGLPLDLDGPPTAYPGQWKVPQAELTALLGGWARGLGADVRAGCEVAGLAPTRHGVEVTGPGGTGPLQARYVVGCDGEDSTVRRLAGIGFPGTAADKELLGADVAGIDVRNRRFERTGRGLATAFRRPDGVTRLMVHEFGRPVGPAPAFADVAAAWLAVTGEDVSGGTARWLHGFRNDSRLAERYRAGRVLLAGDAAHRQLPVGGQALNLGLADAANLGWKLAAVATGRAPDALLDTYHDERHAAGRLVLDGIRAQTTLLVGGPEVEAARTVLGELMAYPSVRAHLAGTVAGLAVRAGSGPHPAVGTRLAAGDLARDPAELLRAARGVLLDVSGVDVHAAWLARTALGWSDRVDVVPAGVPPGSPLRGLDSVLLRPDGHLAWVGTGRQDPRTALRRWFGPARGATRPAAVRATGRNPRRRREASTR